MIEEKTAKTFMAHEKTAKALRVITVPPVLVTFLILVLAEHTNDIFIHKGEIGIALLGLGIIPVLAYPLQRMFPGLFGTGREKQRKLAFLFSLIGYAGCYVYGIFLGAGKLCLIFYTYFYSVVLLTIFNKFLHIRASGHALSSFTPVVLSRYFVNFAVSLPFLALFFASVWSSVYLKRHKPSDIAAGMMTFVAGFLLAHFMVRI